MARKYDLISELYNRTCKTVVSNPQNWQASVKKIHISRFRGRRWRNVSGNLSEQTDT